MKHCPCDGCIPPKRKLHCHSSCKEYKEWAEEVPNAKRWVKEQNKASSDCTHRCVSVSRGKRWN